MAFIPGTLFTQSTYTVSTVTTNGSGLYDISDNGSVAYKGLVDGDAQIFLNLPSNLNSEDILRPLGLFS